MRPAGAGAIRIAIPGCAPSLPRPNRTTCPPRTSSGPFDAAPAKNRACRTKKRSTEGYGPGGAALIIDTLTDNKNRTVGELRHLLEKHGGNLAAAGAVGWMFSKRGYIVVEKSKADEEKLMNTVLEAGADDFQDDDDNWEILTPPEGFTQVHEAVKAIGVEPATASVSMIPQNYVKLEGKPAQQMVKLMEALEDHDDVQHVWSNFDISEKEIEASLA